jgi:arsenate reductase (glutaredoxin)
MSEVVIYHNPGCSKSRETLALLRGRGVEPKVVAYLEAPPDAGTLDRILRLLGMEPKDLMRKKEEVYGTLGIDERPRSREALIRLMVEHPILIERPIVVKGDRAALGRPPENVLKVL